MLSTETRTIADGPLRLAVRLLPFVFALHNLEEAFGMEKWSHEIPPGFHAPVTTAQFGIAVGAFTLMGLSVLFPKFFPNRNVFISVAVAFSGMLFLNVFFPHVLATLYLGRYAPGVVTAAILNLPLSTFIIFRAVKTGMITWTRGMVLSLVGGATGALLAVSFLRVAEILLALAHAAM